MKIVEVAAGVIYNPEGEILIAKRADNQHQGGLWEFPGGKIEQGESAQQALARELYEELAIKVSASEPLVRIAHDYTDKSVVLDVWCVTAFSGEARGVEGQPLAWVSVDQLTDYEFPAANEPIIAAVLERARNG
jgi:8-oxo-dGTP diphosphatase